MACRMVRYDQIQLVRFPLSDSRTVTRGVLIGGVLGLRLSELRFTTLRIEPKDGMNLDNVEVSRETGEFLLGSLAREVDRDEVNEIAVKTWIEKASGNFLSSPVHIRSTSSLILSYDVSRSTIYTSIRDLDRSYLVSLKHLSQAWNRCEIRLSRNETCRTTRDLRRVSER